MEPWGLRPKKFQTSVAVPPAPVRVPSQRPLAPSVTSITSVANDNEMILGAVHRFPGISLQVRKPQKTSARRSSDEGAVRPVIVSNGLPFYRVIGLFEIYK